MNVLKMKRFVCATAVATAAAMGSTAFGTQAEGEPFVYSADLAALNDALRAAGHTNIRIDRAEILVAGSQYGNQATTIVASDRTHLLPLAFVENDPRRSSPPNTLTYLVDKSGGNVLSWSTPAGPPLVVLGNSVTEPELDASMAAWGAMNCNPPAFAKVFDNGADPDLIDGIVLGNPAAIGTNFADITHAGWLGPAFFDALVPPTPSSPGGSTFILGVTLSFVFIDGSGNPTDLDNNGLADVAFTEIYYNQSFPWGPGGNDNNVDIQSVAIHEVGHALGLGHFGKVFIKANNTLQFAPKAIMNAVYVAEDRAIRGSDNGSFCQLWANKH